MELGTDSVLPGAVQKLVPCWVTGSCPLPLGSLSPMPCPSAGLLSVLTTPARSHLWPWVLVLQMDDSGFLLSAYGHCLREACWVIPTYGTHRSMSSRAPLPSHSCTLYNRVSSVGVGLQRADVTSVLLNCHLNTCSRCWLRKTMAQGLV